jgi:radical SAM protein with 4Fe4S-binding SPASM domain
MLFSIYINVKGEVYPCSFIEGQPGYEGLKIDENTNFVKDIWYHPSIVKWREKLLATANCEGCLVKGCRQCPEFDIY